MTGRTCVVVGPLTSLIGCAKAHDLNHGHPGPGENDVVGGGAGGPGPSAVDCDQQVEESTDGLPEDLACVGLYLDVAKKKLAKDARSYAPAYLLWSDGAEKERWI